MKKMIMMTYLFFLPICALDVTVETLSGNRVIMELEDFETISSLQKNVEEYLNLPVEQQELLIKELESDLKYGDCHEYALAQHQGNLARKATSMVRNYDAPVTCSEKKDIRYIVTTLADKSLLGLLRYKSSLESAGDRINHIHPLRFLMCVFSDPELKESLRDIYKRGGWVWSDFVGGLNSSLEEESYRNNLRDDQIMDFASAIGINTNLIFPSIRKRHWTDFVVTLIKKT